MVSRKCAEVATTVTVAAVFVITVPAIAVSAIVAIATIAVIAIAAIVVIADGAVEASTLAYRMWAIAATTTAIAAGCAARRSVLEAAIGGAGITVAVPITKVNGAAAC